MSSFDAEVAVLPTARAGRPRRIVNFEASLREVGATASILSVTNLSTDGCRVPIESEVQSGALI